MEKRPLESPNSCHGRCTKEGKKPPVSPSPPQPSLVPSRGQNDKLAPPRAAQGKRAEDGSGQLCAEKNLHSLLWFLLNLMYLGQYEHMWIYLVLRNCSERLSREGLYQGRPCEGWHFLWAWKGMSAHVASFKAEIAVQAVTRWAKARRLDKVDRHGLETGRGGNCGRRLWKAGTPL